VTSTWRSDWSGAQCLLADAAARQGRRFRGFLDRLAWAEKEVKQYLRGGKRFLSLHDWTTEEPWLQHAPHRVLLDEGNRRHIDEWLESRERRSSRQVRKEATTSRPAFLNAATRPF